MVCDPHFLLLLFGVARFLPRLVLFFLFDSLFVFHFDVLGSGGADLLHFNNFFSALEGELLEELDLVLELSIFVDSHSRVGTLSANIFEGGIDCDSLHILSVPFKGLDLLELIVLDSPEDGGSI